MNKLIGSFTVFFESPFWVGVFERQYKDEYSVAKIIFGSSEPTNKDLEYAILYRYDMLSFHSTKHKSNRSTEKKINFKRSVRQAKKEQQKSLSTKSQQALQNQKECKKEVRKKTSKMERVALKKEVFKKRQEKKKKKHKHS